MTSSLALSVEHVSHNYGEMQALRQLDLEVHPGEIFGLLGPNGSGKTTLFRLISTLLPVQSGEIKVFGQSLNTAMELVRGAIGIVFQSPSLDPKLSVLENIRCQAALYGIRGKERDARIDEVTGQLGIQDRLDSRCEDLSGGLKRRVELAKGILHRPRLLLMDEPSTGLDPAARLDMWHALQELQSSFGVTILLTTHLLEEADKANRIAILHEGSAVAVGAPTELRGALGEQVLRVQTTDQASVMEWLEARGVQPQKVDQQLRVNSASASQLVEPLSQAFGERIQTLSLGQPSLEDVFIARTGHRFWSRDYQRDEQGSAKRKGRSRRKR